MCCARAIASNFSGSADDACTAPHAVIVWAIIGVLVIVALPFAWTLAQFDAAAVGIALLLFAFPGIGIAACWYASMSARKALIRTVYHTLGEEVL